MASSRHGVLSTPQPRPSLQETRTPGVHQTLPSSSEAKCGPEPWNAQQPLPWAAGNVSQSKLGNAEDCERLQCGSSLGPNWVGDRIFI